MKKNFNLLGGICVILLSTVSCTFAYSLEQENAYLWAYNYGITTQPTIEEAKMNSPLTRQAFAKMVVNYLENVVGVKQATSNSCYFPDESKITNDLLPYTKKACAYGIMGSDGKNFNPTENIDRAQLGTVFSRIMWGDKYNVEGKGYYIYHVNALKDVGIMNKIDNVLGEPAKRGDVMIMFQRMFSKFGYTSLTSDEDKIITFLTTKHSIFLEGTPVIDNNGNWESYYENGQLEAKGIYKNGALNGEFLYYYKNGQLRLKCNFKDGIRNGEYVSYYKNGQIMQKMNLKDGKTDGEEIIYNEDGQIVSTCNCVYGANSCNCVDYFAPKWEVENKDLPDYAEISLDENMVVGKATNIGIKMMKDGSIMTGYTGEIQIIITDENGAILNVKGLDEYELPNPRIWRFEAYEQGFKQLQKGLIINKEGSFYIWINDLFNHKTLCKKLVTVVKNDFPDSAEISVEKNIVAGEATNLKITMMKDGSVMTGYTGTIVMMVSDENGRFLNSSEYSLPNLGLYSFLPGDLGSKEFQKGLEIKKAGSFYIQVEDLDDPDEKILGKQLVKVIRNGEGVGNIHIDILNPVSNAIITSEKIEIIAQALQLPNSNVLIYIDDSIFSQTRTDSKGLINHTIQNIDKGNHSLKLEIIDIEGNTLGTSDKIFFTYTTESDLPKISNIQVNIDDGKQTAKIFWDTYSENVGAYLIKYRLDNFEYTGQDRTETKSFMFTDVPYDTPIYFNITPYQDINNEPGKPSETIQFILHKSKG